MIDPIDQPRLTVLWPPDDSPWVKRGGRKADPLEAWRRRQGKVVIGGEIDIAELKAGGLALLADLELFGLEPPVTQESVVAAYREKSREFNPEVVGDAKPLTLLRDACDRILAALASRAA